MQVCVIEVLVVDNTVPFQTALDQVIGSDPALKIVGSSGTGDELKQKIRDLSPNVIILNALAQTKQELDEFLAELRGFSQLPVVAVVREEPGGSGRNAFDFVKMPDLKKRGSVQAFGNELCVKLKISAQMPAKLQKPAALKFTKTEPAIIPAVIPAAGQPRRVNVIAIGASTGGTEATAEIMVHLPPEMPGIVIVQHMPPDFTRMYAERLNRISKLSVSEATDGARLGQGIVLVAPGGKQMYLRKDQKGYYVSCQEGDKINGHCPSVGVLFDSVAQAAGSDAVGVILTGMGKDGAEGLLRMRQAGAFTVGQDESTCVVYGMPMVAYEIGAVAKQAPLGDIANILVGRV